MLKARRRRRRFPRKRVKPSLNLILVLVVVVCGILSITAYRATTAPNSGEPVNRMVSIDANTSMRAAADNLYQAGLIRSPNAFLLYLRITGKDRLIKAGDYQLPDNLPLKELINQIYQGNTMFSVVVVPEGYTLQQIADTLEAKGMIDRGRFFEVVEKGSFQYAFLAGAPEGQKRLEGFLYPATYKIPPSAREDVIIDTMLHRFEQFLTPELEARRNELGMSYHDMVTLASMVEREAQKTEEQPVIAGVLNNRLKRGMLLQVDATVQYAMGTHRDKVYYKDLEVDSPYNTYRYKGLPQGPIASPGENALKAVLYPAEHSYLYYVARPDGSHVFSKTLEEHNQAKKELGS
ncbi:MAG: endolytic transglycosylase MltG [Firmicutes bacterium]|nr:endolytic transglycosylase MltG [Bacillota bacterium]